MFLQQSNNKRATLSSIARDLGLATSTVSFCLSGKAARYGIKDATVKMVCNHANKVGYVVNSAARQLRGQSLAPVGLLFNPQLNAGEMPLKALSHAQTKLNAGGMEVRIVAADIWEGTLQMQQLGCQTVIVFSTFTEGPGSPELLQETLSIYKNTAANLKIYAVNYSFHPQELPIFPNIIRLGINRYDVNKALCDYLLKLDNNKIILQSSWCRVNDNKFTLQLDHSTSALSPFETGRSWAHHYLEMRKKYDIGSIMPGDDRISAGLISELQAHGVKIPGDVRIISFDNLDFGSCLAVPLTSWGVPMQKHVDMVLDNILDHTPIPDRLVSVPDFTWRESSGFTSEEQKDFMQIIEQICKESNNKNKEKELC